MSGSEKEQLIKRLGEQFLDMVIDDKYQGTVHVNEQTNGKTYMELHFFFDTPTHSDTVNKTFELFDALRLKCLEVE